MKYFSYFFALCRFTQNHFYNPLFVRTFRKFYLGYFITFFNNMIAGIILGAVTANYAGDAIDKFSDSIFISDDEEDDVIFVSEKKKRSSDNDIIFVGEVKKRRLDRVENPSDRCFAYGAQNCFAIIKSMCDDCDYDRYVRFGKYIASGAYNSVYNVDGNPGIVVRITHKKPFTEYILKSESRGVSIQEKLGRSCPNLVPAVYDYGKYKINVKKPHLRYEEGKFLESREGFYALMEKVDGYELFDVFNTFSVYNKYPKNSFVRRDDSGKFLGFGDGLYEIWLNIYRAIKCIHDNDYLHLDIKPENIMVISGTFDVRVIDFGFSMTVAENRIINDNVLNGEPHDYLGTDFYNAPEINDIDEVFYQSADIWPIGVLFFEYLLINGYSMNMNETEEIIGKFAPRVDMNDLEYINNYLKQFLRKVENEREYELLFTLFEKSFLSKNTRLNPEEGINLIQKYLYK